MSLEVTVTSVQLYRACLLIDRWRCAPPCWLFGLRHPSTGDCRLLGGARPQCQYCTLQESSCQSIFPGASATSVLDTTVSHSHPHLPRRPSKSTGRSLFPRLLWSHCFVLVAVHVKSCVSPPRRNSCNPALMAFKARCSGDSSSQYQTLRLGNLMWGSELTLTPVGEPLRYNYFPV